jgi:presenilin-like A22 family membrane protease
MLNIFVMFMIVQFSGLLLATMVFSGSTFSEVSSTHVVSSAENALFYIVYIVIFALIIIFVSKVYRGNKLFLVFEGAVLFLTSFFVFLILVSYFTSGVQAAFYGNGLTVGLVVAAVLALALVVAKNRIPKLRNTAAIIASMGVGVVLGVSFSFLAAMVFMMILAVYDFVAVFITKHMITLANAVTERNLAFFIGASEIEALPQSDFSKADIRKYEKMRTNAEKKIPQIGDLTRKKLIPVEVPVMLGTGDLGVPLMVSVSAYSVTLNFMLSFFITLGSIFGLIITMYILVKAKRALPAIPPLLLGILIFLGFYLLLRL